MKKAKIIICMVLVAPLFALADQPASRPTTDNLPARSLRGQRGRSGMREPNPTTNPSDDLVNAMKFMSKASPNRARAMQDLSLGENAKLRLQRQILNKWHNYTLLSERFPDLADLTLQQIGIEDDIYGLTSAAHHGPTTTPSDDLREKVRDKVTALVDLDMKEQDVRINQLEKLLDQEKTARAKYDSEGYRETQINDRLTTFLATRRPTGANGEHGAAHQDENNDATPETDPNPGN